MLGAERGEQQQVDHDRLADGRGDRVIDAARDHDVAHEADEIQEGRQEQQIGRGTVDDRQK